MDTAVSSESIDSTIKVSTLYQVSLLIFFGHLYQVKSSNMKFSTLSEASLMMFIDTTTSPESIHVNVIDTTVLQYCMLFRFLKL